MSGCAFWRTSRKDHDVKVDLGGRCTGPLLADVSTTTPSAQTPLMNQGGTLALSLRNTPRGLACPSDNFTSGDLCEYSDMTCRPAGPRPVIADGTTEKLNGPIAGCLDNYFQNGDLHFDGSSYIHDWPDGSAKHPASFAYTRPFTHGRIYPKLQFGIEIAGSEADGNAATGAGHTAPQTNRWC